MGVQYVPHTLQIVLPFNRMQSRTVHQNLTVYSEMEKQSYVGFDQSVLLLVGQIEPGERGASIFRVLGLESLVAVEFKQKLLHVVQAHQSRF